MMKRFSSPSPAVKFAAGGSNSNSRKSPSEEGHHRGQSPPLSVIRARPSSFAATTGTSSSSAVAAPPAAAFGGVLKSPLRMMTSFGGGGAPAAAADHHGGATAAAAAAAASHKNGSSNTNTSTSGIHNGSSNPNNSTFDTLLHQPLLTPARDGSMVVLTLSPSRTITDSLAALSQTTGQQLEEIWDEVGYSPEERAAQLSDLLSKFREICEAKVAEERGVADTFRQTIDETGNEIMHLSKALKTPVDPSLHLGKSGSSSSNNNNNTPADGNVPSSHHQTLTDQLATLEAALEGLRTTADAARAELRTCRDYLVDAHDALGIDMDPKWRDVESDLTTKRIEAFHRKRSEMKEELSTRTAAVIQLVRDCQHLMNDLKIDAQDEEGSTDLDRRIAGSLVRSKDGGFIMASKIRSQSCVGISSPAVDELTKRVAELHGEKRRRKAKLQEMGAEIASLWEKLRVPEDEQLAFTQSVQGLGMDTIRKGQAELQRLHDLKSKMLGDLIREARETISDLWEQINAPQDQRRGFEPFHVRDETLFTDELLDQHEQYVGLLSSRLEKMKPILRIIERREDILRERMEYEELQKDSERLKQRGAALTKQLMEEEKMARRIKKELPRLTDLLTQKLSEWKQEHDGEDFVYRNESYFDTMDKQEEEWQQYKDLEMQRKLKKKQSEKAQVENRFVPKTNSTLAGHGTTSRALLGDARGRENASAATTTTSGGRHQQKQKSDTKKQQPHRTRSHDARAPKAKNERANQQQRGGMGTKQLSTRF